MAKRISLDAKQTAMLLFALRQIKKDFQGTKSPYERGFRHGLQTAIRCAQRASEGLTYDPMSGDFISPDEAHS
jgi:hypothetical protein